MLSLLPLKSDKSDVPLGHLWLPSTGTGNGNSGHRQLFCGFSIPCLTQSCSPAHWQCLRASLILYHSILNNSQPIYMQQGPRGMLESVQKVFVHCAQIGPFGTDGLPSDVCGSLGTLLFEGKVWSAIPIPRVWGTSCCPPPTLQPY